MSIQQELESLIKNEVLLEIDDYIDELFEIIASKKDDASTKEELTNMQEMKKEFNDLLIELENGEISDDECQEIIDEIHDMLQDDSIED